MWLRPGSGGDATNQAGISGASSSSTRPHSTPKWPGCMGAVPWANAASARCPTVTGRPRRFGVYASLGGTAHNSPPRRNRASGVQAQRPPQFDGIRGPGEAEIPRDLPFQRIGQQPLRVDSWGRHIATVGAHLRTLGLPHMRFATHRPVTFSRVTISLSDHVIQQFHFGNF